MSANEPGDAIAAEPPPARERRFDFSAAPRTTTSSHSRLVRRLKLVLPAVAAILVTVLIAWPQLQDPARDPATLRVHADEGSNLSIRNPRYVGSDPKDRPFTVTADTTRRSGANPDQMEMEKPRADITLTNGAWVALTADKGMFDRRANTLALSGDVQLFHDEGYQVRSDAVIVDLTRASAVGNHPVVAQGPAGVLSGAGFRVENDGNRIFVDGPSRLQFNPQRAKEAR